MNDSFSRAKENWRSMATEERPENWTLVQSRIVLWCNSDSMLVRVTNSANLADADFCACIPST
jgi:hypothetical protein